MPEEKKGSRCPECSSQKIIRDYDVSEIVCQACGYVIDEKLVDSGPEWRAFSDEQKAKRTRVGAPLTYTIHDKGLSTVIDWRNKSAGGKDLDPSRHLELYKLRKWQGRIRVSEPAERNLADALAYLQKFSSSINLPGNIHETASVIYKKAWKKRLTRGRSTEVSVCAAVYMACRQCLFEKSLKDISKQSGVRKKDISRTYRLLGRELPDVYKTIVDRTYKDTETPELSTYVSKIGNKLGLSGKTENLASRILDAGKEIKLASGKDPSGQSAVAIYIATLLTGDRRTQKEIADIANITEVTLRNRYKNWKSAFIYKVYV